jgi:ferredoxin
MAITRVWIEEGCITCGLSEINCAEVFKVDYELDSSTVIKGVDFSLYEDKIKYAAEACPVEVIRYEET